ncbi:DNA-binding transcriptional regulator IlvY [Alcanivorax sp. 521-1]|uniref:DNA-binding transcriptional regulator IlvY n=1 Tax=Alloalcanivorax profundimaris TaxID=2735259 RepID=A0ABS0AQ02_9GAMM|nr:HTH-type transcriptional activator IlvY [Alloalcanivorax profundimaris]MBF5055566.1 DNA-binding transcriptional regulator IlvY [Alloalcanivorax profundimaris]
MDTRSLRLFLALAETLHFGRAGDRCHMSPSAVSRTIRQLENDLGAALFLRDNRSVSLTAEGRRFQQYARETLAQWDSLRHSMQESSRVLQGELSLYCSVTASYSFLYDILSRFRNDYPGIEIKLHTGDPAHAMDRVMTGREDIAIGARPDNLPRGVAFRPILRSPLLFIAPTDQPELAAALAGPARAEAWREVPMILSEEGLSRQRLDQWFRTLGIPPRIYAQVSGNEAIVSMVSLGFGVGVAPRIVLDNSPLADRTRPLDVTPALADYEVGLFTREKRLADPVIQAFWSQLR